MESVAVDGVDAALPSSALPMVNPPPMLAGTPSETGGLNAKGIVEFTPKANAPAVPGPPLLSVELGSDAITALGGVSLTGKRSSSAEVPTFDYIPLMCCA